MLSKGRDVFLPKQRHLGIKSGSDLEPDLVRLTVENKSSQKNLTTDILY